MVETVGTRDDLVQFIRALRTDLGVNEDEWENPTLDRYLEALAAWTNDMDGYFRNHDQVVPTEPTWGLVAQMLLAAHGYE